MPMARLSPTRGVSLNTPVAEVAAVFWSKKAMLPAPPLQKTAIWAAHFVPPSRSTRATGFLVGAIRQPATGTVVATDRNLQFAKTAVANPATALLTAVSPDGVATAA